MSSSSSIAGGRQTLNELEGRMELGIELGEEVEEEAHLSPAYRSESSTELWIMSRTTLASQVIVMNCMVGVVTSVVTVTSDVTVTIVVSATYHDGDDRCNPCLLLIVTYFQKGWSEFRILTMD